MPTDVIIDPSTGQIYWNDNTGSPQSISIKGDALNAISVTGYSASFSPGSAVGGTTTLVTFNDNSGAAALVPGTSGFDLGSSSLRWNTFATNANLSGTLVVSDSTISASLITGSARFNGGIAISGNASVGQSLNFYNTAATFYTGFRAGTISANTLYTLPTAFPGAGTSVLQSDTSGTLTWIGAVGLATTSTNINVVSASTNASHPVLFTPNTGTASGAAVSSNGTLVYNPFTDILSVSGSAVTSGTISTSTTSGAFQVRGGIGITGNAFIGGTINVGSPITIPNGGTNVSSFGQSAGFVYYDGANVRLLAASGATINYSNGYYQFDNRVYATSFFANNAQMPNGSGIAGRVTIWSGNNTIGSDAEFTYDSTNNILNVSGNINAIGFTASGVAITSGTASTSTTTGALVVAGGVGISGRLSFNQASFGTTGITTVPTMAMIGQTGDPIYLSVLEDNSISFEGSQGQLFSISPNLTTGYIWAVNDISGVPLLRANSNGNVFISEFGGNLGIGQTNPTYKVDLKGNFALASSNDNLYNFIFSNSSASGSNSLQIRSANSILLYNSGNTFYTGIKSNAAANVTYTLPTNDGSPDQFLKTNGSGTLSWGTPSGGSGGGGTGVGAGGQYEVAVYPATGTSVVGYSSLKNDVVANVVSISHSTASTNFANGALTVSGGVGIGGSLYVGGIGASISGVRILTGTITAGTWNGTAVGTQYGGTGQNFSSSTGLLRLSSGTASVITSSSDLANVISDETGSGSLVFATGPTLVTPNIGAATGTSLYLSAVSPSTSTTTGALIVPGGVGVGLSVSIGGRLQLFNSSNYAAFLFSGTSNTTYTLPSASPATGTSVLQSDSGGIMSWVPMVASGGAGSGTVAIPGAQFQIAAYYSGTGASVSGSTTFTNNTSTSQVTINHNTATTSTTSGALVVSGGLGLAGNAFIGGTAYIPSSTASNISNLLVSNNTATTSTTSGALVVNGGLGLGGNAFIGGTAYIPSATASNISNLLVSNNTATTSTTSGALVVNGGLGLGGNAFIGGTVYVPSTTASNYSNLLVSNSTATTSTTSGALVVTGGAAVGQSVSVGGSLNIFNGSNYSGFRFAGSANTTYTLPPRTPTGTATSYLSSGIDGVMAWVAAPTSGGSGSVNSGTATYAAFYATTSNTVSDNANLQFTGTGVSIGGLIQSTSTTSGSIYVYGGVGITGNAFIGGTAYIPSTTPSNISNLLISNSTATTSTSTGALVVNGGAAVGQTLSIGGSLNIFNGSNYSGFRFAGSANTTYILPPRTPTGTGTSYLSSSIDGIMAWVAAPTGGSATPGGSNRQIQYNNSTTFGGASGFEYTTGGTAITVSMFSPSGVGYTSGLWVHAINGSTTRIGIGLSNPAYELEILGEISATNKSFVIDHPTKDGMKLRYGSLEGPENGVYVRGELNNSNIIEVPDHWLGLVHPDSYTVHLTPIGRYAQLYVEKIENYNVFISDANLNPIHCYYSVWAERKDIPKLITEYEAQ